jgi:hypothetical protein
MLKNLPEDTADWDVYPNPAPDELPYGNEY